MVKNTLGRRSFGKFNQEVEVSIFSSYKLILEQLHLEKKKEEQRLRSEQNPRTSTKEEYNEEENADVKVEQMAQVYVLIPACFQAYEPPQSFQLNHIFFAPHFHNSDCSGWLQRRRKRRTRRDQDETKKLPTDQIHRSKCTMLDDETCRSSEEMKFYCSMLYQCTTD